MFFQLFAAKSIAGLLPDKNQPFWILEGVKLPLYPLISAKNIIKCLKNVKKIIKIGFSTLCYEFDWEVLSIIEYFISVIRGEVRGMDMKICIFRGDATNFRLRDPDFRNQRPKKYVTREDF